MVAPLHARFLRAALMGTALATLAACSGQPVDWDLRQSDKVPNTAEAARSAVADRPAPDARGVISYPTYQAAVAQRGDTVASLAARVGLPPDEVARHNGLQPEMGLRAGELLMLPRRVSEPVAPATGGPGSPVTSAPITGGAIPGGQIDITTLAGGAIERAGGAQPATGATNPGKPQGTPGREPFRHQVVRGETAFTIARLYSVPAKALADWNGLGPDMAVREGQYLMIPVPGEEALDAAAGTVETVSAPGAGSATPVPPSAAKPLPAEKPLPASAAVPTPASPDLGAAKTTASAGRFTMPTEGKIIRAYEKGKNEGIDIASSAGAAVRAAADGTVAAITQDTSQVQILILRHADGYLTVYANVEGIKVAKGATVKRGQTIAATRAGSPAFVHFEVRKGTESLDPVPLMQ